MSSKIKIGDKVVTRHTPPIKGVCTRILKKGKGTEYCVSYNKEGDIMNTWLDPCEVELDDEHQMGFKK